MMIRIRSFFAFRKFAAIFALLVSASQAFAGPYSSAASNTTDGAIDAAIYKTSDVFVGWATSVVDYSPSAGVSSAYQKSANSLGSVDGTIVSLGDLYTSGSNGIIGVNSPGTITLAFDAAITDGEGADFAVFENGFTSGTKLFAELAYVEVSTDGVNFVRFASVSLTGSAVGAYGTLDPTNVYNLAGKNAAGWGTPFDLSTLSTTDAVLSGLVDLSNINYVRLIDIPGSGYYTDSLGNPIYDAWATTGSGGLDLDAVGVINAVPEPAVMFMTLAGIASLVFVKRKRNARPAA